MYIICDRLTLGSRRRGTPLRSGVFLRDSDGIKSGERRSGNFADWGQCFAAIKSSLGFVSKSTTARRTTWPPNDRARHGSTVVPAQRPIIANSFSRVGNV